jgi:hypothetical protein
MKGWDQVSLVDVIDSVVANVIPFLCVGTSRLLVLAPISNAGLFAAGQAPLTFRGSLGLLELRVLRQFGSGVFSGEVGGRREFARLIAGFHSVSNRLRMRARRRVVSAHAGICACSRLHQPKQQKEGRRHERQ